MISHRRAALVFLVTTFVIFTGCAASLAGAQAPRLRIVALDSGTPAPYAGMLVPDDELVAWRREIERLRFEVELARQRADALRAADAVLAEARARAGDERLALSTELWTRRAADLTRERDEARAKRGPRWWQRGALWLPIGFIVGGSVVAIVEARR